MLHSSYLFTHSNFIHNAVRDADARCFQHAQCDSREWFRQHIAAHGVQWILHYVDSRQALGVDDIGQSCHHDHENNHQQQVAGIAATVVPLDIQYKQLKKLQLFTIG